MKTLYFDCFSGISGDMTLGAFLDLGVNQEVLINELKKLNIDGYEIKISKKSKNGIMATDVDVIIENMDYDDNIHVNINNHNHMHNDFEEHHHHHINDDSKEHYHIHDNHGEHHHRSFSDIRKIIESSDLDEKVKDLSIKIFYNIAKSEGKIHGKPIEEVHFHEVGAIDSIVDIVGATICFNELNVDKVVASKLNLGMGTVKCQHGIMPVPAPATLEILKEGKVPIFTTGIKKEIVTPTGAAIVATLAEEFSDIPEGVVLDVGYGAGKRDLEVANVLRLMVIEGKKKL